MAVVRADPDKIKQFARALTITADQLQQVARSLSRALDNSGLHDAERQKFEQDFMQTVKTLNQISENLKGQYAPALQKKAAALEKFQGH